jgi:hypothetical protein
VEVFESNETVIELLVGLPRIIEISSGKVPSSNLVGKEAFKTYGVIVGEEDSAVVHPDKIKLIKIIENTFH